MPALCKCPDGLTFASTVSSYSIVEGNLAQRIGKCQELFLTIFTFVIIYSHISSTEGASACPVILRSVRLEARARE